MCRGGGSRAQGLVRAGAVPTTPRSLERVRRDRAVDIAILLLFKWQEDAANQKPACRRLC